MLLPTQSVIIYAVWLSSIRVRAAHDQLNPDVLMMEPAEDWNRCDTAGLLRTAKIWGIFIQ